jgi:hypothetical protein
MDDSTTPVDPTRCPLCGGPNACAMTGQTSSSPCWCVTETFTPELLARVPVRLQRKSCICATCARAATAPATDA